MSRLFGGGSHAEPIKPPDPVVAPPTIDDAAKVRDDVDRSRRKRGRAASMLTGSIGAGTPTTATTTLTGS